MASTWKISTSFNNFNLMLKLIKPSFFMSNSHNLLSIVYLTLAILGALLTMTANLDFLNNYGPSFDIMKFISLANINPAAQSLSRDLLVGASAVTIWMFTESRRLNIRHFWVVMLTTFTIAFAFGAPLFLFLRERRLLELNNQ